MTMGKDEVMRFVLPPAMPVILVVGNRCGGR